MDGSRIITTDHVKVIVTSDTQKLHIEAPDATAVQTIGIDSAASGILDAVTAGDVFIKMTGFATDFPPTKYRIPVEFEDVIARGMETYSNVWSAKLPGFPMKPVDVVLTFNVDAAAGGSLVVDTLTDGSLIGDIDTTKSTINWSTGDVSFIFNEDIANRVPVRLRIRYPGGAAPETNLNLSGVPYSGRSNFVFQLNDQAEDYQHPKGFGKGTIRISALDADGVVMQVIDDGQGNLVGDILPANADDTGETNIINYVTGVCVVVFARPVERLQPVKVKYGVLYEVQRFAEVPERETITLALRYDDLKNIVDAADATIASEQALMSFR